MRIVRYELGKRLRSVKVKSNEIHCPTSIAYQSLGGDCWQELQKNGCHICMLDLCYFAICHLYQVQIKLFPPPAFCQDLAWDTLKHGGEGLWSGPGILITRLMAQIARHYMSLLPTTPWFLFYAKKLTMKTNFTNGSDARKWYQRGSNRLDCGALYVSITSVSDRLGQ